jgi:hypothetical protein
MRQALGALWRLLAGATLAGLLLLALGYWQATRPPRVEQVALILPGLAPGASVRVLLLSDLHGGLPEMPRARIEAIVDEANALEPDLILLAGDFHTAKLIGWPGRFRLEDSLEPLARLRAPLGVFAVRGNHDNHWTNRVMGRAPSPVLLVNTHVDVGPFILAGIDSGNLSPDLAGALRDIPPDRPLLLLAHEQGHAFSGPPPRPLLLLAGDTHGGQIWLGPWLGAPARWGKGGPFPCRRGRCSVNGWPVYVTSGLGTSWVPLRIGVPPEMVLLRLQASSGRNSGTER